MKKGFYYFLIRSKDKLAEKKSYFASESKEEIALWVKQIHDAKAFFSWFLKIKRFSSDPIIDAQYSEFVPKYMFINETLSVTELP